MSFSIRSRIILGYLACFIILLLLSIHIWWSTNNILTYKSGVQNDEDFLTEIQKILVLTIDLETAQRGYLITGKREYLEPFLNARSQLPKSIALIDKMELNSQDKTDWNEMKSLINQKKEFVNKTIELKEKGGDKALRRVESGKGKELMDQIRKANSEIDNRLRENLRKDYAASKISSRNTIFGLVSGMLATFIFLTIVTVILIRSIYKPINDIANAAAKMGTGDFSFEIPIHKDDELGTLSRSINSLSRKIYHLMAAEKKLSSTLENLAFTSVHLGNSAIFNSSDLNKVMQEIVDKAKNLIQADYAALGIGTDPEKSFDPWVYSGIDETIKQHIGKFPGPVGVLGWVAIHGEPLRTEDLKKNPIFRGFPDGHPMMGPLLGLPIRYQGQSIGNLYFARKDGGNVFTEPDQKVVGHLTSQIGIILENFKLQSELKKAVSSREDVLAIVSHDLRSPLTIINMSAEMLAKKTSQKDELSWIKNLATKIESASAKMKRMINDLLDAAAIESGKIQVNVEPFRVHELLDGIKSQFYPIAQERNIDFEVKSTNDDVVAIGDMDRLHQVFSNLIGNSVKFTPQGGKIRVVSECMDGKIHFSVSDTGPGISEENQKQLFDRYWQVEGTKAKGTGLGLYITKGIIDAHEAKLEVISSPGNGTTFRFNLQLAKTS